jgi:Eukaryotic aspartyl protease
MEKINDNDCGRLRLTPSDTKFGKKEMSFYWVLGDIFLQNYYSIYDFPAKKLGLIESNEFGRSFDDTKV